MARDNPSEAYFVTIITATADPNAPPERVDRINYHSRPAQEWLHKHMWWSLHNGFTVHIKGE